MESAKFRAKQGRPFKYPEAWFDGNTRVITRPADFSVAVGSMLHVLRERGRNMGGYCSATETGENQITLCYYPPGSPEAEEQRRKRRAMRASRKRRASP